MNLTERRPRPPRSTLTPSRDLGNRCGAYSFPDPDRCLQPTGGVSDFCLAHRSDDAGPRCQFVLGVGDALAVEVCGAPCFDRLCPSHEVVRPAPARTLADFRPVGTDVRGAR